MLFPSSSQDEFDDARDALGEAAKAYAEVHLGDVDGEGGRVPIMAADIEQADEIRTVEVTFFSCWRHPCIEWI